MPYRHIKSFADILQNEITRFKYNGFHQITAFAQFFAFFYFGPEIIQALWRFFLTLGEWRNVFLLVGTLGTFLMQSITNLTWCLVYKLNLPYFEQFKVTDIPWPWEQPKEKWIPYRNRMFKFLFINYVIMPSISTTLTYIDGYQNLNYKPENFPSKLVIIAQFCFFVLCEDCVFYITHRLFHWGPLYKYHKVHHEHANSISCTASHTHPVNYIFSSFLSFISGYLVLGTRVHYSTFVLWSLWRVMETADVHCGYYFPWSMFRVFPFSANADFHSFHHTTNLGNYASSFTYMDTLFGTSKDYFDYKALEDEKKAKLDEKKAKEGEKNAKEEQINGYRKVNGKKIE